MSNWIYPFKGRGGSFACHQNFLWERDNVYIMDNHRAALWCWLQHVSREKKYDFVHIDAHYDTADEPKDWIDSLPDLAGVQFSEFDTLKHHSGEYPAIKWDNYLSIFLRRYGACINRLYTTTHGIGPKPEGVSWEKVAAQRLPWFLSSELEAPELERMWIVNLDLDYFFCDSSCHHLRLISDAYIDALFNALAQGLRAQVIAVITIALSPECCGGWRNAEQLCERFTKAVNLDFVLPP